MRRFIFLLLFICSVGLYASDGYMFRVQLKDKGKSSYTVDNPEEFLSKRAIERRRKQKLAIDKSDLPISANYIKAIEDLGYVIVAKSKWLSTVSVFCEDSVQIEKIKELPFVDSATFVWKNKETEIRKTKREPIPKKVKTFEKSQTKYGYGYDQIKTVNGDFLHEKGYIGRGFEIAVIDAGYTNLNDILLLDNVVIKGIKDFVYQGEDILQSSDHGLKVLSVMAANRPETFIGTAPGSKYWLLRSEDGGSEYPIEEDYWVAAAEYADSIGVDIINTSLGYYRFDFPAYSYTHDELDGKTAYISRGAEVATQKGIFVEISAGNEGGNSWDKIVFPADVENVLTVGAMTCDSLVSSFSSRGYTADGRVKPDVLAMGSKTTVVGSDGEIEQSNGTSFAGPVMSGLAACLWEAFPELTNLELLDVIRKSANKYEDPNFSFGYGIPNMQKAFDLAEKYVSETKGGLDNGCNVDIYPIDSVGGFRVKTNRCLEEYEVFVSTLNGKIVFNQKSNQAVQDYYLASLDGNPVYVVSIRAKDFKSSKKIKF